MNRKYTIIDKEKLNVSNWLKWLILIAVSYLSGILISFIENQLSRIVDLNIANIMVITFYIRAFIVLSLIHDLAPKFKKTISIIWSLLVWFIYVGVDRKSGDTLFLGSLLFLVVIIVFNIFLYKRSSHLKSTKDIA